MDNHKKIYFCSNNSFLACSNKILKTSGLLGIYLFDSTDSSINAINFTGRGTLSANQICFIVPSNFKN